MMYNLADDNLADVFNIKDREFLSVYKYISI